MDPLLIVSGIMMALGATYWWQQQMTAIAGADGMNHSFYCLISAGFSKCPDYVHDYLQQENLTASIVFYAGVIMLLYCFFSPRPPHIEQNRL